ncbi:MAG: NCS2 family permease [Flavobacteriales bacterium]|nr:NCS2 family permease [Flavobacteriales bacterium]
MLKRLFVYGSTAYSVKTEILAGITTFLAMAYILGVNPAILSAAGMDKGAVFTTTALISAIATFLMAMYAKLPFALAPGMGLNAFFAYTVCVAMGYSWQMALTAVFVEGVIFIALSFIGIREKLVYLLPEALRYAITVGIGLFIAFIGLKNMGLVVASPATLVTIGDITSRETLLGIIGLIFTAVILIKNIKGGLLLGIVVTAIIGIPMGVTHIDGVVSLPPSIEPIFMKLQWGEIFSWDMALIVFTLLFMDLFDTLGTLVGVSTSAGMIKDGRIPRLNRAFMVDAVSTTLGSMMGSSTVTSYAESATGVKSGGRTGLTAAVTAICFIVALFFAPFFLSVPQVAIAPSLVLVGLMMASHITSIDFTDFSTALPAFVCFMGMPLTYSISDGLTLGYLSYVFINMLCGNYKKLSWGMYLLSGFFMCKYLF